MKKKHRITEDFKVEYKDNSRWLNTRLKKCPKYRKKCMYVCMFLCLYSHILRSVLKKNYSEGTSPI